MRRPVVAENTRVLASAERGLERLRFEDSGLWNEEERSHFMEEEVILEPGTLEEEEEAAANLGRGRAEGARWEVRS